MGITQGTAIRFRCRGSLGVLDPDATRPAFDPDVVIEDGDEGVYLGPAMGQADWHIATIERDGVTYRAPVHRSMFEATEATA